jgi:uncharacterized membrane protein (UPF0127 family)
MMLDVARERRVRFRSRLTLRIPPVACQGGRLIEEPLKTLASAATIAVLSLSVVTGACLAGTKGDSGKRTAPTAAKDSDARRAEVRFPDDFLVVAEIADTPARLQRGYMFRNEVREGDGMVFLFASPDFHSFWMKNTLVPLDIIWMDDAHAIIHIQPNTPPCKADPCPSYSPMRKAAAVLEVRAGTAAAHGLKMGDRLSITIPQSGE